MVRSRWASSVPIAFGAARIPIRASQSERNEASSGGLHAGVSPRSVPVPRGKNAGRKPTNCACPREIGKVHRRALVGETARMAQGESDDHDAHIEALSAVTLSTQDMARAVAFYRALGFRLLKGGPEAGFTTFAAASGSLNLMQNPSPRSGFWGRVIFHVRDVDALYEAALRAGLRPAKAPQDAPWGERFFHLTDPDGHELSFARPLGPRR